MTTAAAVTNQSVALVLNLTHSAISRLRSGNRRPSFEVMYAIWNEYDWDLNEQAHARRAGTWSEEFEKRISLAAGNGYV